MLAGGALQHFPKEVKDIKVGRTAASLIFLQGTAWCESDQLGTLWKYIIHYADGQTVEVPVTREINVRDWWSQPSDLQEAKVAWSGGNMAHAPISLYSMEWINQHPQSAIESIDIVSDCKSVPFVLAITGRIRK